MLKRLLARTARKKTTCCAGPVLKKTKNEVKTKKNEILLSGNAAASALEPAYRSILSATLKLGFRRAAINAFWREFREKPQNWKQKKQFSLMKNAVFFSPP